MCIRDRLNILDGVTSTAAELNIVDGNTSATSTTLADADRVVVNDAGTMKQVAMTDVKTYMGGGGLVLLNNTTNASSVGDVAIDNVFTSTYKNYKIIGEYTAVDSSGNTNARFRFRTGGSSGSLLTSTQYNYHFLITPSDSTTVVNNYHTADGHCEFTTQMDEDSQNVGVRFDFTIFDPVASKRTTMSGQGRSTAQDGNSLPFTGACDYKGSDSVTGIYFYSKTGNIKDIAIKIYGIVDS